MLALASCNNEIIEGNGVLTHDTLNISNAAVQHIKLNAMCKVEIIPSINNHIIVSGDENLVQLLDIKQNKQTLIIENKKENLNWNSSSNNDLIVKVYSNAIQEVTLGGIGTITAQEPILASNTLTIINSGMGKIDLPVQTNILDVTLSGAGNITLKGAAVNATIKQSGAGSIEAFELATQNANINLSGAGSIQINTISKANAIISGVGSIKFKSKPSEITEQITGLGKISYDQPSNNSVDTVK